MADALPDNPYAPPAVHEPGAAPHQFWRVDGSELWVRSGAAFEGIDLITGKEVIDPVIRRLNVRPVSLVPLLIGLAIFPVVFFADDIEERIGQRIPSGAIYLVIFFAALVLQRFVEIKTCHIAYPEPKKRVRLRRIVRWSFFGVALVLYLGVAFSLPLVFSSRVPSISPLQMVGVSSGGFLTIVVAFGLILRRLNRKPWCSSASGEWMHLKGVSRDAIDYLKTVTPPQRPSANPNRRTYVIHLAKFRWIDWCRVLRWKPIPCFNVAVGKLLRSRNFDSIGEVRLMPETTEADQISAAFREKIAALQAELDAGGWSFGSWDLMVFPDRFGTLVESANFLHQEGQTLLSLCEVRGSFAPQFHVILHSWLADGKILRTSDERTFPVMNPSVEWECLPGNPRATVISKHLHKSRDRQALILSDATEGVERLIQLNLDNHAWLHAKGIYGPLEEIPA